MNDVESLDAPVMGSQPGDENNHIKLTQESDEETKKRAKKEREQKITIVHEKALDDLVGVNSLLAMAIFVGISLASRDQHSLENRPECDADPTLEMRLVLFEVVAFGLFILSTLVAKATKVHINMHKEHMLGTKYKYVRGCFLLLSVAASFLGVVFLTFAMVDVVQIKIGKLACGSEYAFRSVASLTGLVFVALLVYAVTAGHAIYLSMTYDFDE